MNDGLSDIFPSQGWLYMYTCCQNLAHFLLPLSQCLSVGSDLAWGLGPGAPALLPLPGLVAQLQDEFIKQWW